MPDMVFIIDDGDGTVTVEREPSWNTPKNKPNQLAKFLTRDAPALPAGVDPEHYAWDGTHIVECSQEVKDALPVPPEPTPARFEAGVDAPLLVLDAPDGQGVGYVADAEGNLVPVVYAHESPYDMAALKTKIAQARIDNTAARTARQAEAREAGKAAGEARSMNELRAEVARLAAIVEGLA